MVRTAGSYLILGFRHVWATNSWRSTTRPATIWWGWARWYAALTTRSDEVKVAKSTWFGMLSSITADINLMRELFKVVVMVSANSVRVDPGLNPLPNGRLSRKRLSCCLVEPVIIASLKVHAAASSAAK